MKTEKRHIEFIKNAFAEMQSKRDFLDLLNYAKPILFGEKTVPFSLKQLTFYVNPKRSTSAYKKFYIKKKSGTLRTIYAPTNGLKAIQKTIAFVLQCVFEPHKAANGFVWDKSIVNNAKVHTNQNYVYNIDLKDFFPSIDQARVWKCLTLKPFNLNDTNKNSQEKEKTPFLLPYELFNFKTEGDINDVLLKFKFSNADFKNGSYNLKLKNGGNIAYKVAKYSNTEDSGVITLFKGNSSYDIFIDFVKNDFEINKTQLNNLSIEFDAYLNYYVGELIKKHQELQKDRNKIAIMIATLCCTNLEVERLDKDGNWEKTNRNVLPQGAPTSPVFSNIICQRLDFLLAGVAKRFNLNYTRYADDITFSSMHNVYQENSDFIKEIHRIIKEQHFHIKESKTRLQKSGYRQEVTGLVVNDAVNVKKRYVKQLRMWLYYWEKYGYNKAEQIFLRDYIKDRGYVKVGKPDMVNVISGKLDYLKMVKGEENPIFIKLRARYDNLKLDKCIIPRVKYLESILKTFVEEGLDKAMNIY